MGGNDTVFEQNVKVAFSKVKEHIIALESEVNKNKEEVTAYKQEIINLKQEVENLRKELVLRMEDSKPSEPKDLGFKDSSSGNKGVYSFNHSFVKQSLNSHSAIQGFKQDFDKTFSNLSQQEFLTFLTIYQLEEEIQNVSYVDVSRKLNLTEGCIRTYISSLLKKGVPLIKYKYNNKQVFLRINPEFRALSLKQKLIDTFYHTDSNKKTIQQTF